MIIHRSKLIQVDAYDPDPVSDAVIVTAVAIATARVSSIILLGP